MTQQADRLRASVFEGRAPRSVGLGPWRSCQLGQRSVTTLPPTDGSPRHQALGPDHAARSVVATAAVRARTGGDGGCLFDLAHRMTEERGALQPEAGGLGIDACR